MSLLTTGNKEERGARNMLTEKSTQQKSFLEAVGKSFYDSIGDIVFGMEGGTVSILGLVFGVASSTTSSSLMISLRKAYGAKIVHLSALLLALLFPLASLVSCDQPAPPLFESLKLGIPAAALQSPVRGPLPDATELHIGITFKIDSQALNLVGQQPLQPGQ